MGEEDNKENKKTKRYNDNSVYIGRRPTMNYVMAAMVILNRGTDCIIKARGRAISHAVDVSEILINKFFPTAKYKDIKITTEHLTNDEGKSSNVSSMEIVISPN
ncbi:MAG: DNA-binding protein Alba [Promethearchaeota archaeon]